MWTVRLGGVSQVVSNTAVIIEGKVYAFSSSNFVQSGYFDDVYIFDAALYRWNLLHPLSLRDDRPMVVIGSDVVAYGHCAYVWGGWHISPLINDLYCFDTRAMTWSRKNVWGDIPTALFNHSACVVGQRMYIFGGSDSDSLQHVHFLDLESFMWHRVRTSGQAPSERCSHTATAIGTRMYVWGGNIQGSWPNDRYDSSLYYLETTTATWVRPEVEGVAPEGRERHAAFIYDEELYIFAGYNELMDTYFEDMHKYDLKKSCWSKVTSQGLGPSARHSPGCSVLGERVFVLGGFRPLRNRGDEEDIDESIAEVELTDLHVLHLSPTLKNLCLLAVIDAGMGVIGLPVCIRDEINIITSRPLKSAGWCCM